MAKQMNPMCIGATAIVGFLVIFFGVWAGEEAFHKNHSTPNGVSAGAASELKLGGANVDAVDADYQAWLKENDADYCKGKVQIVAEGEMYSDGTVTGTCDNKGGCCPDSSVDPVGGPAGPFTCSGKEACPPNLKHAAEKCKQEYITMSADGSSKQFDCTTCGLIKGNECSKYGCASFNAKFKTDKCLTGVKNTFKSPAPVTNEHGIPPTDGKCCNQPGFLPNDGCCESCGEGEGETPFGNLPHEPCGSGGACYSQPCLFNTNGKDCGTLKCWKGNAYLKALGLLN